MTGVVTVLEDVGPGIWVLVVLAVLTTWFALASAAVTTWVPLNTQVPAGITVAHVIVLGVNCASFTVTVVKFTLPVLVSVTV